MKPYKPIDCSIHDRIEDAATRGAPMRIVYETCERQKVVDDVVMDWFTKDGEEFMRTKSGLVLRLDQITDLKRIFDIRAATPADIETIAAYRTDGESGGSNEDRMRRYLSGEHNPQQALPPRAMFVAMDGANHVGYIAGHLTRRFDCDGELQWIYVRPEYRGSGAGTTLLNAMAKWFAENNARRVCVDVGTEQARRFYLTHGAEVLNEHWLVWPRMRPAS